jgi:hypothetical protein
MDETSVAVPTDILRRVADECAEMPGLVLTARQAGRLFGLSVGECDQVLECLVTRRVLRRDARGQFRSYGVQ